MKQFLLIALKILQSDCKRDLKGGWQLLLWAHKVSWRFSGIIWSELWALNFVGRPVFCLLLHIHRSAPEKKVCFEDKELFIWKHIERAVYKIAQGKQKFVRHLGWEGPSRPSHSTPCHGQCFHWYSLLQPGLGHFEEWGSHSFSAQLTENGIHGSHLPKKQQSFFKGTDCRRFGAESRGFPAFPGNARTHKEHLNTSQKVLGRSRAQIHTVMDLPSLPLFCGWWVLGKEMCEALPSQRAPSSSREEVMRGSLCISCPGPWCWCLVIPAEPSDGKISLGDAQRAPGCQHFCCCSSRSAAALLEKFPERLKKGEISGWFSSAGEKNKWVFQEKSWWQMVMALIQESFLLPPLDFSSSQTWKSCVWGKNPQFFMSLE